MLMGNDFDNDLEYFKKQYEMDYEEFINAYKRDNVVINLTGKIVVAIESQDHFNKRKPCEILGIFVPEEERLGYKATLIYAGHIAFIKCEFKSGKIVYYYKDDECCPQNFEECINSGDILYSAEETGFTRNDILQQIQMWLRLSYDFNYEVKEEDLVMLAGL